MTESHASSIRATTADAERAYRHSTLAQIRQYLDRHRDGDSAALLTNALYVIERLERELAQSRAHRTNARWGYLP